jgi:predicted phosphodiesterase
MDGAPDDVELGAEEPEAPPVSGNAHDGDGDGDGEVPVAVAAEDETPAEAEGEARPVRWRRRAKIGAAALVGALLALALAGRVGAQIGPFDATLAARPSLGGETTLHLAPLGTIVLDTHDWPLALDLRADQLRPEEAERIANNPEVIDDRLGNDVADDVHRAMVRLAVRCALVAMLGAAAGALIARLSWRSGLAGLGVGALLVAGVGAGTAASFNANAVSEPRYTGLLTSAPTAVGDIEDIIDRYGEYRAQLSDLVGNVVTLYLAADSLPTFEPNGRTIRVLHISDIHLNLQAFDLIKQLDQQFGIDVIADTGDITDWGSGAESRLVDQIGQLDVPYVFVRGNHDSAQTAAAVAAQPNAVVLDGGSEVVAGLRFWGIGDTRYTPNKDEPSDVETEREQADAFAPTAAERLDESEPPEIDVAMIHDPRSAADMGGQVPLVLAGHTHEFRESTLDPPDPEETDSDSSAITTTTTTTTTQPGQEPEETLLMVEGSTGGAGLRGLQGEEPHPLTASVLYFDPATHRLLAYDHIIVQGFGETAATIERHILLRP